MVEPASPAARIDIRRGDALNRPPRCRLRVAAPRHLLNRHNQTILHLSVEYESGADLVRSARRA